jgi:hypothetical protein
MIRKTMAGHTFGIIYYINTCLFNAFRDMENVRAGQRRSSANANINHSEHVNIAL